MANGYRDQGPAHASEPHEHEPYGWGSFALGIILGVILVYVFAVRPSEDHLHELNLRVSRLDQTLERLTDAPATVEGTVDLLTRLQEQSDLTVKVRELVELNQALMAQIDLQAEQLQRMSQVSQGIYEAEVALDRIASLHQRLQDQYDSALQAEKVANQAANLQSQLLMAAGDVPQAKASLSELVSLKSGLLQHAGQAQTADLVLRNIFAMQDELVAGSDRTRQARLAADRMIQIENDLICQSADAHSAAQNLEQLLTMQKELEQAGKLGRVALTGPGELLAAKRGPTPASPLRTVSNPLKLAISVGRSMLPLSYPEWQRVTRHVIEYAPQYVADLVDPQQPVFR